MIKTITRFIRNYRLSMKKARHHKRWAQILHSGLTVRDHKTLITIGDDDVVVDYLDGRKIGQKYVSPRIIRPFGLGRE
ncbi:hypothetical protein REC12_20490 [Desulfosporosinus sp. PR]|uniref:hypothetical protein n=1 Tax=Candidatus Desulfosporosinus nitrosoreducens TaxID=3401928 RepID=UPI0028001880|nr:hypothetical protein [Desulfosporosinus sp. PR]MDQ7095977.1 hypothetical protein [Desulfosporosinus sp. PR]